MTTRSRATSPACRSCPCSAPASTIDPLGLAALLAAAALAAGCEPDVGPDQSVVDSLRVLAVREDVQSSTEGAPPTGVAEAAPGATVTYTSLLVDQSGARPDLPINWAFCDADKPLSDLSDVSSTCFVYTASFLVPLGQGSAVSGALPIEACSLFGPDVPPAMAGMPPGRPADPDPTGGYYQPVRLILQADGQTVLSAAESRILCDLPGATAATLTQFRQEYQANTNPVLSSVAVLSTPETSLTPYDGTGPGFAVRAGDTITLRASWPTCPPAPGTQGCGAETYAYYDPGTQTLTTQRESLMISWFATGGSFASDITGRASDDDGTTSDDPWTAPATSGPVFVWVVLRDDRGGVSWESYRFDVM